MTFDDDETRLRIEALNQAVRVALSTNVPQQDIVQQAKKFYNFLTGAEETTEADVFARGAEAGVGHLLKRVQGIVARDMAGRVLSDHATSAVAAAVAGLDPAEDDELIDF